MNSFMSIISVSIPELNDISVVQTIYSAFCNADNPENLRFSIVSTNSSFDVLEKLRQLNFNFEEKNISIIKIDSDIPLGMGLSRALAQTFCIPYHTYVLQADAHMIFEKGWDTTLVDRHTYLENKYGGRILISQEIPKWLMTSEGPFIENLCAKITVDNWGPHIYGSDEINLKYYSYPVAIQLTAQGTYASTCDRRFNFGWQKSNSYPHSVDYENGYAEHYGIMGHFIFARAAFFEEFVHDPRLFWGGEQEVLALRASTRGYRIFAIKETPIWTQIKYPMYNKVYQSDWRNTLKPSEEVNIWHSRRSSGDKIIKQIFSGEYIGYWGAPDKKSLQEYLSKVIL